MHRLSQIYRFVRFQLIVMLASPSLIYWFIDFLASAIVALIVSASIVVKSAVVIVAL